MENLRTILDVGEINEILDEVIKSDLEILMWQTVDGERKIINGEFSYIDFRKKVIVLNFPGSNVNLDKESTLYIKGEHKSILFKEVIHGMDKKTVIISIPMEIMVIEYRETPRVEHGFTGEMDTEFYRMIQYGSKQIKFQGKILDISRTGIGLASSSIRTSSFGIGEKVFFSRIKDVKFEPALAADLVHSKNIELEQDQKVSKVFRLGFALAGPLDQDTLNRLK